MAQLEEIASATHHPTMFADILHIINKRLNDHGKYWRHVYKTLLVLEYCICCGSEAVVTYANEKIYEIRTLKQFVHIDEMGRDQGINVRQKSQDIIDLLTDANRLAEARRLKNVPQGRPASVEPLTPAAPARSMSIKSRSSFEDLQDCDEDQAMRLAIEESKRIYERESKSRSNSFSVDNLLSLDDSEFGKALDQDIYQRTVVTQRYSLPYTNTQYSQLQYSQPQLQYSQPQYIQYSQPMVQQLQPAVQQQRSHSYSGGDPFEELKLLAPPKKVPLENPFNDIVDPFNKKELVDPFHVQQTEPPAMAVEVRPAAKSEEFVPMPLAPGQAPVNHLSVGEGNIGIKPVAPHQVAPQYNSLPEKEHFFGPTGPRL